MSEMEATKNSNKNSVTIVKLENDSGSLTSMDTTASWPSAKFRAKLKRMIWLCPIVAGFLVPVTCFVPYFIAITSGLVYPILPYVSDTGGFTPAANIFSQLLDTIAVLGAIGFWGRYQQVSYYCKKLIPESDKNEETKRKNISKILFLNKISIFTAISSIFGLIVIGNFRMTEMMLIHVLGAGTLFFGLLGFVIIQVIQAIIFHKYQIESRPITLVFVGILYPFSLVGCMGFSFIGIIYNGWYKGIWDNQFRLFWSPKDEAYIWHCLGTLSEWIAILNGCPLLLSLGNRMRKFNRWDEIL